MQAADINQSGTPVLEDEAQEERFISVNQEQDGFLVQVAESSRNQEGKFPTQGETLRVHYTGKFEDGRVFDSSRDRDVPLSFSIGTGQVIKCWEEGFMYLKKQERAKFTCPPSYAYGPQGHGRVIPPNSTLYFDVELLDITPL